MSQHESKPDNAFLNLLFNIIIPVLVLNKLSKYLGSFPALILGLSAPLAYGIWDLWRKKKINYLSILGLLNVGITGSLAVLHLEGPWFWIKEAAFPALVGIFVLGSRWTERPFIQTLILNPQVMNLDLIQAKVQAQGHEKALKKVIQNSTVLLSISFFISAVINFFLSQKIFIAIPNEIQGEARSLVINEQIAEMTKLAFPIIFIPSMIILTSLLFYLMSRLKKLTGLTMDEIMPSK